MKKVKKEDISCPRCGQKKTWVKNNPSRPFCSPRCKLIDLGAWADENHRIPGETASLPTSQPDDEADGT